MKEVAYKGEGFRHTEPSWEARTIARGKSRGRVHAEVAAVPLVRPYEDDFLNKWFPRSAHVKSIAMPFIRTPESDVVARGLPRSAARENVEPIRKKIPLFAPRTEGAKRATRGRRRSRMPWTIEHALLLLALLFAFGLGIGGYAVFGTKPGEQPRSKMAQAIAAAPIEKLTPKEETREPLTIDVTGMTSEKVAGEIARAAGKTYLLDGHEREVRFARSEDGKTVMLNAQELLHILAPRAPDALLRALDPEAVRFMLRQGLRLDVAIIIRVRSYPYAAGEMREWERAIVGDILPPLAPWRSRVSVAESAKRPFTDIRTETIDARAVMDQSDAVAFIYAFPDRGTLLLTTSAEALAAYATTTPAR